jgi:hypothetical protein
MAGGARPEFERGRGFRWPEAAVRVQKQWGGRRCSRGGVWSGVGVEGVDEWARSCFERLGRWRGSEGKKERGGGGPAAGVPRGAG